MGLFDKLERRLERTVNGAFAKAFRAEVQPVEIASAMRRAMDNRASSIGKNQRPIVPNVFDIELSGGDFDRLTAYREELSDELIASALEHVDTQRYTPGGPVAVTFSENTELETGVFHIRSSTAKHIDNLEPVQRAQSAESPDDQAPYASAPEHAAPHAAPDDEYAQPSPVGDLSDWPTDSADDRAMPLPSRTPASERPIAPAQPLQGQAPPPLATGGSLGSSYPAIPPHVTNSPNPASPPAHKPQTTAAKKRPWLDIDGERYPLLSAMTVIGRDDAADVILDDPGISRQHSEIRVTFDGPHLIATLRDLGSTNGTYVNGDQVSRARLIDGDRITIGRTTLTIHMGGRR